METCHRAIGNSQTTTSWKLLLDECHNKRMGFGLQHVSAVTPDPWQVQEVFRSHLKIRDCWAHLGLLGDQMAAFTPGLSVALPESSEPLDVSTEVVSNPTDAAGRKRFAASDICPGARADLLLQLIVFTGNKCVWPIIRSDSLRRVQTTGSRGEFCCLQLHK